MFITRNLYYLRTEAIQACDVIRAQIKNSIDANDLIHTTLTVDKVNIPLNYAPAWCVYTRARSTSLPFARRVNAGLRETACNLNALSS